MVAAPPDSALPHPTTTTEEASVVEEAIKRNTDCVYFLASPLTCKKGSDCEYRHSEYARVNPRDCWYWMTSNCLNPKCAFRHPPLDGLLGTQAAGLVGASIPDRQSSTVPALQTPHDGGKQAVPCIFFQKGFCMKGVKCAFLHGISPASSKPLQSQRAGPSSAYSFPNRVLSQSEGAGPSAVNSFPGKTISGLKRSQDLPRGNPNSLKMTAIPVAPKPPVTKAETVFSVNGDDVEKNTPPPRATIYGFSTYRPPTTTLANGSLQGRISHVQQATNADDYSSYKEREADDFLKESSPGFDVLVDDEPGEADYYHCEDQFARSVGHEVRHLSSMEEYDLDHAEEYSSLSDLDREMFHNKRSPREYGWDQHHDFSPHRDGRAYFKGRSPSRLGESDLRYCLSKQRRVNGLRSVVNHDFDPESHSEDRSGHEALHSHQGSASSRLKGRIKFPGRSDATNGGHMYQGGRFGGRLRTRVNDDHNGGERNISGGSRARRELVNDKGADFAGPKSLAELKGAELPRKSLRSSVSVGCKASFEGPKPLSVHLKRKRGAEDLDNLGDFSLTKTDNPQVEEEQPESGGAVDFEQTKDDVEIKDGVIMEDSYEDPEIDGDDQETGEHYEEQGEMGDYNYDESGNVHIVADGEEEYLDDDDGEEDFAKKVGVMFS